MAAKAYVRRDGVIELSGVDVSSEFLGDVLSSISCDVREEGKKLFLKPRVAFPVVGGKRMREYIEISIRSILVHRLIREGVKVRWWDEKINRRRGK